jgi:RNA polymerase sigma-70 factor, ECF subfamily
MSSRKFFKLRDPRPGAISLNVLSSSVNSLTDLQAALVPEPFDRLYVRRLAAGDPETESHFMAYFDDLLAVKLRARLRSKHAIEDIRQETYARVFEAIRSGRLSQPVRLGAFMHSVCNRVLLEFYRADTRTLAFPLREPADRTHDIESQLVNAERLQQVRDLVHDLPSKDRWVVKLLFFEDYEKDEVCRLLGVDRSYLRVLVHRATTKLRRSLVPI